MINEQMKRTWLWRSASHLYWSSRQELQKLSPIRLLDAVEGMMFDIRYRTGTRHILAVEDLGLGEKTCQAVRYQPSSIRLIRKMVRASGIDPAAFAFIDLGCGRGRALVIAARLGFREIIGIELSAALARDAAALARSFHNVSVVTADASRYRFPEGPVFVFLYNPFHEEVLREVIGHLPPCIVGYANCMHAEAFDEFELIASGHHTDDWRVYRKGPTTPS